MMARTTVRFRNKALALGVLVNDANFRGRRLNSQRISVDAIDQQDGSFVGGGLRLLRFGRVSAFRISVPRTGKAENGPISAIS
jgi:hypothetical protein